MTTKIWKPTDNTDRGEKIAIRRRLLGAIGSPSVLECFAGEGKIWQELYRDLPYLGLDLKAISDERPLVRMDNRQYLRSADLSPFNFFDLDAYGSPWHQFLIVLHRRLIQPGEKIAVALTDGLDFKMRMSGLPDGMRSFLNLPKGMNVPCLNLHHEFIAKLIIRKACVRYGLTVDQAFAGNNPRKNMLYIGLIISKKCCKINGL
jgi:hypothetical protein